MATYQLWSPWTPLDEHLQWLRRASPKRQFRSVQRFMYTSDLQTYLCFNDLSFYQGQVIKPPNIACRINQKTNKMNIVKPQPVRLKCLDVVFGRIVTIQPPKWSGPFRVSDISAFSKVISPKRQCPPGLKETQIKIMVNLCRKIMHSILLLCAAYKKCASVLQHSL